MMQKGGTLWGMKLDWLLGHVNYGQGCNKLNAMDGAISLLQRLVGMYGTMSREWPGPCPGNGLMHNGKFSSSS